MNITICIGRPTIDKAASGQAVEVGQGVTILAADDLFHASPYVEIENLRERNRELEADAAAMAPRIQAGDRSRDEVIEECAALAGAHHPPELRSGIDPEAMDTINAERRGELIAADEIAVRLRRLKTKPLS